jgi:hypothetical protein
MYKIPLKAEFWIIHTFFLAADLEHDIPTTYFQQVCILMFFNEK